MWVNSSDRAAMSLQSASSEGVKRGSNRRCAYITQSVPRYEAFARACVYGVTRQCLRCESLGGAAAGVLINVPIDRSLEEGEVKVHSLWPKVTEPGSGF